MFKNCETAAMLAAVPTFVWWHFHRCALANLISAFVLKGSESVFPHHVSTNWVNLTFMGSDSEC